MEQMEFRSREINMDKERISHGSLGVCQVGCFMAVMRDVGTKHLGGRCHRRRHDAHFGSARRGAGAVLDLMVGPTTEKTEVVG